MATGMLPWCLDLLGEQQAVSLEKEHQLSALGTELYTSL